MLKRYSVNNMGHRFGRMYLAELFEFYLSGHVIILSSNHEYNTLADGCLRPVGATASQARVQFQGEEQPPRKTHFVSQHKETSKHCKSTIHIVIVKAREKHKDKDKWEIHNALNFVPSCTYLMCTFYFYVNQNQSILIE